MWHEAGRYSKGARERWLGRQIDGHRSALLGRGLEQTRQGKAERRVSHQGLAAQDIGEGAEETNEEECDHLVDRLHIAAEHARLG